SDPYATSPHGSGGSPTGSSGGNPARTDGGCTYPEKIAFARFICITVDWYFYFLFYTDAIFSLYDHLFLSRDLLADQLASLSTFAVAFVARPLGGLIFGHFGDKLSRKSMLVLSLLMMGVATFAIGLLPGYDTIGVAAPILLVLLRVAQGFGVGGE